MAIKAQFRQQFTDFISGNKDIAKALNVAVKSLDDGLTPMQTEDALHDFDLTVDQIGEITSALTKYHQRGSEFRIYWNKRNNVPDDTGLNGVEEMTLPRKPITMRKQVTEKI